MAAEEIHDRPPSCASHLSVIAGSPAKVILSPGGGVAHLSSSPQTELGAHMSKELIVSATSLETILAIVEDDVVTEIFVERAKSRGILGNIYKGRVTKVLPGMQAAFVDIGLERHAFLYVSDFSEEYEEYEDIFGTDELQVEELLKQEAKQDQIQVEEPKKSKRSKRKRDSRSRKREGARAASGETGKAEPEPPLAASDAAASTRESSGQSRGGVPEQRPAVVPLPLSFAMPTVPLLTPPLSAVQDYPKAEPAALSANDTKDAQTATAGLEGPQTLAEFTPAHPPEEALPSGEASLGEKPDQHQLATARPEDNRKRRSSGSRKNGRPLISDLLREGQEILVQVAKEPIAKKGARITSYVAIPGRHLVYMPTVDHVGVSRKIASDKERQRLREIVLRLRGDFGKGFIVRTAGENHTEEDLRKDMVYLRRLWDDIRGKTERLSAPALVYSELALVQRVIRDFFSEDYRAIRVDDEHEYERIVDFVSRFNPELVNRVRLYNKKTPILEEYGIVSEIEKAMKPKVWLKNGGYIVVNQTEALVAIDVNTGKFVGSTNSLEDTITRTNLDAVKEVVRQIRLRDLGGIIVIDFIDMDERRNRQKVMDALQQELARDKSLSKILQFNEFGLVAITRKRSKQSLERTLCQPCIFCGGTGNTKSSRTICYSIHTEVRRMLPHFGEGAELLVRCHPEVGKALRESEKQVVKDIEEMTGKIVTVTTDPLMHIEQFDVVET
jgi:Rne/Rng family ribonuclease